MAESPLRDSYWREAQVQSLARLRPARSGRGEPTPNEYGSARVEGGLSSFPSVDHRSGADVKALPYPLLKPGNHVDGHGGGVALQD